MNIDIERLAIVAAAECKRQQVGAVELGNLISTYGLALNGEITEDTVKFLASGVMGRRMEYRTIPVYFRNGSQAIAPELVPQAMKNWVDMVGYDLFDADKVIKEFLDIHPFVDGNGRVAWILYNRLNGAVEKPEALPYFYGDD